MEKTEEEMRAELAAAKQASAMQTIISWVSAIGCFVLASIFRDDLDFAGVISIIAIGGLIAIFAALSAHHLTQKAASLETRLKKLK
jgi:hypothetical protein